jgi:hypothetical protein
MWVPEGSSTRRHAGTPRAATGSRNPRSHVGRHRVEDQAARSMPPPADHLPVVRELGRAQALLERPVVSSRSDLDDHVDILGRPWRRSCGIGDPERDGGPTDEDDLVNGTAERRRPKLEQLDAHRPDRADLKLSASSLAASERTRPSPIRSASMRAKRSANAGSRRAASGALSCRGSSDRPRAPPRACGHTGGGSSSGASSSSRGGAAQAVGTPRLIPPWRAGNRYLTPCTRNSSAFKRLTRRRSTSTRRASPSRSQPASDRRLCVPPRLRRPGRRCRRSPWTHRTMQSVPGRVPRAPRSQS